MKLAKRVEELPPYLFAQISKVIAAKKAEGIDVVTFGIGDPDLPTPPHVLAALHRAADDPANHRYPESEGLPRLRQAIADWYERRFEVALRRPNARRWRSSARRRASPTWRSPSSIRATWRWSPIRATPSTRSAPCSRGAWP